jgi:Family of unknown function (DUF6308)
MSIFGGLDVPDDLLDRKRALGLLARYLCRDEKGHFFSGSAFDAYGPASGGSADLVTDSDLIALALLGIRVTGHEALAITHYHADEICRLLCLIPPRTRIEDDDAGCLLDRSGPAWELWALLSNVKDRQKNVRLGPVASGKLLAHKRPGLIPISDSRTASTFKRRPPGRDASWWDDVRAASRDPRSAADGMTLWEYLASLRSAPAAGHLPVLRVLDILAWMHDRA